MTVEPHGTFANFHIVTTHPVKVTLEAHEDGKSVASATFNLLQATDWQTTLLNLTPGTKYLYTVKAWDGASNTQYSTGAFATLCRQVTMTVTDLTINAENDEALDFWFNTANTWDMNNPFSASLNAGESTNPNYTKVLIDVPDATTFKVYSFQDDCDFAELCDGGFGPNGPPNGSTEDADWATATATVNGFISGLGEAYSDTFTMTSPSAAYQFTASGTYKAEYVK